MDYQIKYLKYKNKYLTLKNQMKGGGKDDAMYKLTNCDNQNQTLNVNSLTGTYSPVQNYIYIKQGNNNLSMTKDYYNNIDINNGNCRRNVKPDESCINAFNATLGPYNNEKFLDNKSFYTECLRMHDESYVPSTIEDAVSKEEFKRYHEIRQEIEKNASTS